MEKRAFGIIARIAVAALLPLAFGTGCLPRMDVPCCCCCCAQKAAETVNDSLRPIYFAYNEATLTPASQEQLDKLTAYLKNHPSERIMIAGNCGTVGTEAYNMKLGERRAESAKQYLIDHGVAGDRIETVSYGKERPVVKGCTTEECNTPNRRDDFTVIE